MMFNLRHTKYKLQNTSHKVRVSLVLGLVLLFSFCLVMPAKAGGASLYLTPASNRLVVGEEFSVAVKVATGGTPINAVKSNLGFDQNKLSVVSISKKGSILSLWPEEPSFSNISGTISFLGGLPHPGYNGEDGLIITVKFRTKKEGRAGISFGESAVLADDGKGTDIFSSGSGGVYEINAPAPEILSTTHSDPNKWYSTSNLELHWDVTSDITDVSFILDKDSYSWPDEISEGRLNSINFKEIKDGIWYFHLRVKIDDEWSAVRHFTLHIDTQPPHPFEVIVDNGGDPTNPQPTIYFDAQDDTSGIDYYRVEIGQGDNLFIDKIESNPYQIPPRLPGSYPILVEAVDKAENSRQASAEVEVQPIETPALTIYPEKYVAGEEIFYLEGTGPKEAEITIFLKVDGEVLKEWRVLTDRRGEWSFSTKELLKSGVYRLEAQARDERGAVSEISETNIIEVSLSGVSFGPLMVSFRKLILFLGLILLIGAGVIGYYIWKIRQARKILKIETREVRRTFEKSFYLLKKEMGEQIEKLDKLPGFNKQEKKLYDDLINELKIAKETIGREIEDVEREVE